MEGIEEFAEGWDGGAEVPARVEEEGEGGGEGEGEEEVGYAHCV